MLMLTTSISPIHTHSQSGYGVRINAVSVVNLVMAVGLAVEFVVHVATAFLTTPPPPPPHLPQSSSSLPSLNDHGRCWGWGRWLLPRSDPGREARAKAALSSMGASVISVRAFYPTKL